MNALNAWMLSGDERDHLREQTRKRTARRTVRVRAACGTLTHVLTYNCRKKMNRADASRVTSG